MSGRRLARPQRPPAPLRLDRRRTWPLLVALVPLAGWLAWRTYDDHRAEAAEPARPPSLVSFNEPTGERTTAARCWMVAIDDSGSMSDADAAGTRGDAVRATGEFLDAYGLAGDRLGVTWFANVADVYAPVAVATSKPPAQPTRELGAGTEIAAALTATFDAMDSDCDGAERVAVLVSDGQTSSAGDFAAIGRLLSDHDVTLHLVAMNGDGAFESVRTRWTDEVAPRSVQVIDSFGGSEVATAVAAILSQETGQEVTAR